MVPGAPKQRFASIRRAVLIVSCGVAAACGSRAYRSTTEPITESELQESNPTTVYEAVQRLRPTWLLRLGSVFLDDERFDVEALRTMSMVLRSAHRARLGVPGHGALEHSVDLGPLPARHPTLTGLAVGRRSTPLTARRSLRDRDRSIS